MLCGPAGSKVRGQTAGDCGGGNVDVTYHCCVELVPRVLVDDVSSFPEGWRRTLVLIFREIFRKNSELHGKKCRLLSSTMFTIILG